MLFDWINDTISIILHILILNRCLLLQNLLTLYNIWNRRKVILTVYNILSHDNCLKCIYYGLINCGLRFASQWCFIIICTFTFRKMNTFFHIVFSSYPIFKLRLCLICRFLFTTQRLRKILHPQSCKFMPYKFMQEKTSWYLHPPLKTLKCILYAKGL